MVDVICMGVRELQGARSQNYKNLKKILSKAGLEFTAFELRSYYPYH